MLSIVMCSRDDARFARSSASYARVLAGVEYEIVRISDARSICEGYNRGIARVRGEHLLLSHDDIEILCDDFAAKMEGHFRRFELFGIAGTTRLIGPTWSNAGPPYMFGQVVHEHGPEKGLRVHLYGVPARRVPRAQAVDGVLIGVHRRVCDAIPFDEQTFTGFHHYDIDFSYRAFLAGFSCGIVLDLDIFHFGVKGDGYRTPEWLEAAMTFYKKHQTTLPPLPEKWVEWNHSWVRATDLEHARRLMRPEYFEPGWDAG